MNPEKNLQKTTSSYNPTNTAINPAWNSFGIPNITIKYPSTMISTNSSISTSHSTLSSIEVNEAWTHAGIQDINFPGNEILNSNQEWRVKISTFKEMDSKWETIIYFNESLTEYLKKLRIYKRHNDRLRKLPTEGVNPYIDPFEKIQTIWEELTHFSHRYLDFFGKKVMAEDFFKKKVICGFDFSSKSNQRMQKDYFELEEGYQKLPLNVQAIIKKQFFEIDSDFVDQYIFTYDDFNFHSIQDAIVNVNAIINFNPNNCLAFEDLKKLLASTQFLAAPQNIGKKLVDEIYQCARWALIYTYRNPYVINDTPYEASSVSQEKRNTHPQNQTTSVKTADDSKSKSDDSDIFDFDLTKEKAAKEVEDLFEEALRTPDRTQRCLSLLEAAMIPSNKALLNFITLKDVAVIGRCVELGIEFDKACKEKAFESDDKQIKKLVLNSLLEEDGLNKEEEIEEKKTETKTPDQSGFELQESSVQEDSQEEVEDLFEQVTQSPNRTQEWLILLGAEMIPSTNSLQKIIMLKDIVVLKKCVELNIKFDKACQEKALETNNENVRKLVIDYCIEEGKEETEEKEDKDHSELKENSQDGWEEFTEIDSIDINSKDNSDWG